MPSKKIANDTGPERKAPGVLIVDRVCVQIDSDTKDWIRTAADQMAADNGMKFDGERGLYVAAWMQTECYLYEGIGAGSPIKLMPYQDEYVMRLYSWVWKPPQLGEWIRRFRKANLICPKKNGKTPFMAANELYMCVADGEQGQKCYTAAKNGQQAGLAQDHAIAMAEQSPNLIETCDVNKSTKTITHKPTRSQIRVLSGDDKRDAQAREGINGSVFIDELHVFDREMNERTSRAGISRKEPLNLAFSTAGDDPASYGFERTEYGRQVNSGQRKDMHFLHVEYAAPEKVTNAQIAENLVEYGKQANPAWGYTVNEYEYVQDYEESKDKARELNRFKQYRLNLWIGSVSPWLNQDNWIASRRVASLAELRGRDFRLGVDLSRTRDMTALVMNFPAPEIAPDAMIIWPLFWCPKQTVEKRANLHPYLDWVAGGWLNVTEGNVVDYSAIENEACDLIESNDLVCTDIYFDQHYAEEFSQRLADRLNANRTAVSQTLMTLSPLCKELERRIDKGSVVHNGNPVMDWQIGLVQVITDANRNIRPVKPDENSGKSIDGIMALVDTMAGVVEDDVDNTPGVSFL